MPAENPLIVALDVDTVDQALALIHDLGPSAGFYKIGMELYAAGGMQFVAQVSDLGKNVFLDLKLPLMSGHEVLAWIRSQRQLESLLVVVLTSSNEPSDVRRSYSLGANSYLMKPLTARQLVDLAKAFNWSWLERTPAAAAPPQ